MKTRQVLLTSFALTLPLAGALAQPMIIKSDASTLAAVLWVTNQAELVARLDSGNTAGLTFAPALVGAYGSWTPVPSGSPAGTKVVNIPPGAGPGLDGQHGFFKITFTLPSVGSHIMLTGRANVDDSGRVFLNGHPLTPGLGSDDPGRIDEYGGKTFSTTNTAWFQPGVNELVISDWNGGGGPSGAAFYAVVYPSIVYWTGGSGAWSQTTGWTPAPPGADDVVILPPGSAVEMDLTDARIGGLVLEQDSSLGVPPGALLTILGALHNSGTLAIEKDGVVAGPAPAGGSSGFTFVQERGVTSIDGVLVCDEIEITDGDFKVESDGRVGDPVGSSPNFTQSGGTVVVNGTLNTGSQASFSGGIGNILGKMTVGMGDPLAGIPAGQLKLLVSGGNLSVGSGGTLNVSPMTVLAQQVTASLEVRSGSLSVLLNGLANVVNKPDDPADFTQTGGDVEIGGAVNVGNQATFASGLAKIGGMLSFGATTQTAVASSLPPLLNLSGANVTIESGGRVGLSKSQSAALQVVQSAGSLSIKGLIEGMLGQQGGTLSGDGTLDGNLISDDGTINPGASPGTLTITSNFIQNAGSKLVIEVAGANASDHLHVGGEAQLGGTLRVWLRGGYLPGVGEQFTFLSSSNIAGAFANLDLPSGILVPATNTSLVVTGAVVPQGVFFADTRLEDAVITALGAPPGPLAATNLQTLTSLAVPTMGITSLTGLEAASGLLWLNLSVNEIRSIAPLAGCSNLTHLYFEVNQVTNLDALTELTGLEELRFSQNQVASVAPLAHCTNLTQLYFDWNQVPNLDALAGMHQLRELRFSVNPVASVTPLADCTNLEFLFFDTSQVSDVAALSHLVQLRELRFSENQVTNVAPLVGCTNLTQLYFDWNQVPNLDALAGMSQLRELRFSGNPVASVAPLADCTNLAFLYFDTSQVSDVAALSNLAQLRELRFSENQVTSIAPLAGLTNLTLLYFDANQVTNVDALAGLSGLRELRFSNNQVRNIAGLAGLTQLTLLYLAGNQLTDVGALGAMTQLRDLRMDGNYVQRIDALTNLTVLTAVGLPNNYLDLTPGSAAMRVIAALQAHATVDFQPQRTPPAILLVSPVVSGTNFTFAFQTLAGLTYTVQFNDDLNTANWEIHTNLTGDGSLMSCLVPMTNGPQRFFRVRHP